MLINRLNLALLFALTSTTTFAATDNTYQHDASLEYAGSSEAFDDGTWNTNYRYYFTPVSQDNVPYALSGFLAQTSNLGANYAGFEGDLDAYGVNGQYVFASKWFVGANYQNLGADLFDSDTYGVSVGYYFNSTSSVYLGYTKNDKDYDLGFGVKASADLDTFNLGLRSFLPLQTTTGIDLTAQLFFSQSDYSLKNTPYGIDMSDSYNATVLMLSADWYLTRAWSVGANYSVQEDTDPYGISTAYHWRLTDSFSAIVRATKSFEPDEDGVFLALGINGRF
ncbi:putative porin [Shewanella bicestrii]